MLVTASASCIVKLSAYRLLLGSTAVKTAQVIYEWALEELDDGGIEGVVPGVKDAGLQDDLRLWVCGDEFGGEINACIACYGLFKDEASNPASLANHEWQP